MYDNIYIYFDTNAIETRVGKKLFVSQIRLSRLYYEIEKLIKDLQLEKQVHICIPEVAWLEMLEHMKMCYKSEKQSMMDKISEIKKLFGDLVDIDVQFALAEDENSYNSFIKGLEKEMLEDSKFLAEIIPFPKDEKTMQVLFEKAAQSISPFTKICKGKKEYSDAGFKDALIFATMLHYTNNAMGILVTGDTDYEGYEGAFKYAQVDNFRCIKTVEELKTILVENYRIIDSRYLESQIQENEYLFERVLEETGIGVQCTCVYEGIEEIQETDMGQEFILKLRVNGIIQSFEVVYDIGANELVSAGLKED
ncbi:MAG: PIN domain-containing protein [Clostridium sp.]|nr:PIN domain-containing protein [Clostridium sp.]